MQPKHESLWHADVPVARLTQSTPLPTACDALIVGAGISGLTTAALLAHAGKHVVVLDLKKTIGGGETGLTTAHVTTFLDAGYDTVIKNFGQDGARRAAEGHMAAVSTIESLIKRHNISCDWQRVPGFFYANTPEDRDKVTSELKAMQQLGLHASAVEALPLPFKTYGGLRLEDQALFQPLAYLAGLADAITTTNGSICLGTRYKNVTSKDGKQHVETSQGTIVTDHIVYATHTPPTKIVLQTLMRPQRTYVLAFEASNAPPPGQYNDTDSPYHYTRTYRHDGRDLVIVGGCDHRTGSKPEDPDAAYQALTKYVQERFKDVVMHYRWSGQVFEPSDGLPFLGLMPHTEDQWVITALSGHGMTSGTLGALIVSGGVLNKRSPWAEVFSPSRVKPLASATEFLKHNVSVSTHFIGDRVKAWLTQRNLQAGEGALMREGAHAVAAYHDGARLHLLTPICPHAGCYVQFNAAEKCWDCPCHGSRFAGDGQLLSGPATSDLEPLPQDSSGH